tara:strand:+ start:708 stop:899 length:192 start_codon:yes stop_codon:yes gene_type:complete
MDYSLKLKDIYLDWVNNYISVTKFAYDNNLTLVQAKTLIELSREVYEMDIKYIKKDLLTSLKK